MKIPIMIPSDSLSSGILRDFLENEVLIGDEVKFELKSFRSADPTILIAIIASVGTGTAALITGLLSFIERRQDNKIIIQGKSGRRIEIPANLPKDKVLEIIQIAKQIDIEEIQIVQTK